MLHRSNTPHDTHAKCLAGDTNNIKIWWPTSALPGAGYSVTETFNSVANPTPITGPFAVAGALTTTTMTVKLNGTYSYTIRTTALGYNPSASFSGSARGTLS